MLVAALVIAPSTTDACDGDCNRDGMVTIDELVTGVGIALGGSAPSQCIAADVDGNGAVNVAELVAAVVHALGGCPTTPTPTATPPPTGASPTATATPVLFAKLQTDRGCIETGDSPTFAIGEDVNARFRIDGAADGVAMRVVIDI
jgi:hypothetical protein